MAGLSPRVRGNHQRPFRYATSRGSIPARAGEPGDVAQVVGSGEVYPRACGGTPQIARTTLPWCGLSPRVRGNRQVGLPCSTPPGSIPARAGEPDQRLPSGSAHLVYPRACGGTLLPLQKGRARGGLSPRVRGNHRSKRRRNRNEGSIPARAGEPSPYGGSITTAPVYPRACGGTRPQPCFRGKLVGLSPRVRGNRRLFPGRLDPSRSIPARAGEPNPVTVLIPV